MIDFRAMTLADVPFGLQLCRLAGWNQTPADWQRFIALEREGCFIASRDGKPAGTACVFTFGPVAWVAMVLVHPAQRGGGIGTAMMKHAIGWADARGIASLRLDATALGRPIYEKLGFTADYDFARYEGVPLPPARETYAAAMAFNDDDMASCVALDSAAHATQREALVRPLLRESHSARVTRNDTGDVTGLITWRPGHNATQIGPCIASDAAAGVVLLNAAAAAVGDGPVFVDIADENAAAVAWAAERGLTRQRPFVRMTRGVKVNDHPSRIFASSGPEKG
jgi:GNAT superfamily N-acetyltransferase